MSATVPPQYLPLTGGTVAGITFGPNFEGSGLPFISPSTRLVLSRKTAPTPTDYADFQFERVTSYAGGSQANLNACVRVNGVYGPGDATNNWNLVSQAQTSGKSGGLSVGGFFTAQRMSGGTDGVFGAIANANDTTDQNSSSGAQVVGLEVDCEVNKADDAANPAMFGGHGVRVGVDVVAVRHNAADTTQTEVSTGVWFTTATAQPNGTSDPHTNFRSAIGFGVGTQAYQALDTRGAIVPTGCASPFASVRMSSGQIVDFNGGAAQNSGAGNYLQYAGGKLFYCVNGVPVWSVDNAGNMRCAGVVTGGVAP